MKEIIGAVGGWTLFTVALLVFLFFCRVWTLRLIGFIITHTVVRLRKFGLDNLPKSGPVLIVSNHISLIDLLLIQLVCPRKVRFMIRADIINFVPTRFIFWYLGVIRVPNARRPQELKKYFNDVRDRLRHGEVLCFLPEGAISGNGNLMRFRSGVEPLLPTDTEVVVLPFRIGMLHGRLFSYRNGKMHFSLPRFLPVDFSIAIGDPLDRKIGAFELRQVISELGASVERRPQPGEMPLHTAFIRRAKHHPFQKIFCDVVTDSWSSNFSMLVKTLIFTRAVRELDRGEDGYVGVLLPNSTLTAAVLMSVQLADRTPAIINFSAGEEVALESAARIGVRTIFTSRRFLEKIKWRERPGMIMLEDLAPGVTTGMKIRAILRAIFVPGRILVRQLAPFSCYNMHRQAVVLFSSGSTGTPKAVMLTHRNINCDLWSFLRMVTLQEDECICGNLPMFHAFGFIMHYGIPCQFGAPVCFHLNPLASDEIDKGIEKYNATILTPTPNIMQKNLHRTTKKQHNSLRLVFVGAEKLPPELAERYFNLTGRNLIEGYGCTELSPIVTINFNNSIFEMNTRSSHPGSIGCALPGIHVRIIDPETGVELGPNRPGRMQVKAGTVMKGYLNNPEQTARVIQNRYYDTGDIAKIDEDGYIYITGRASRFSKIGGEMVPHEAIEDALSNFLHTEMRSVAVTGRRDGRKGERLVVFYTADSLDIDAATEYLRAQKFPNIWLPKRDDYVRVEALPLLGTGKLDLRKLNEMADAL
ncbi:MAG: AMP-binding protein [Victivallaceae bacterium]|nr:AMP-binding protein [Victivallaceae bacterium]